MISRKYGTFVSSSRVVPCHRGQPLSLAEGRQGLAYVLMAIHAETLDLVHNLDSVILIRLLIVPQAEPQNSLADGGKEVIVVIQGTLGVEVFIGHTVCHFVCSGGGDIVGLSMIAWKQKAVSDPAIATMPNFCPSFELTFPSGSEF